MAQTFEIACHDCQVSLWFGQRPTGAPLELAYLYRTNDDRQTQRDFFYGHIGHRLEFQESESVAGWDYRLLDKDEETYE